MKSLIQLEQITKSYSTKYQRVDLFSDLSLAVPEGELALILGPSGSGKTTLLYLLAGFIRPDSGRILFDGQDISGLNEIEVCRFRNQHIGFVFQFFNLINSFNAEDNILVPLLLAGIDKHAAHQRVDELLEEMGMSHRRKHYPWQLSGGEQQRVAIARALANSPELILADEPTGNLDQKTGDIILDLLSSIHQSGKTVIVVSHDPKMVSRATQVYNLETLLDEVDSKA